MKFAWCGFDYLACALDALVNQGHTLVEVFAPPMDGVYDTSEKVTAKARQLGSPVQSTRITPEDIERLKTRGVELLISAAYPFRIPAANLQPLMAVNLHPSILPVGRGPQPLFQTILKGLSTSAATLHKIEHDFDKGDIILQEEFSFDPDTINQETLGSRFRLIATRLLLEFVASPQQLWRLAKPQGAGEYWPAVTEDQYTISWDRSVAEIDRTIRAFGRYHSVAHVGTRRILISEASVWEEKHNYPRGTLVIETTRELLVAASNGFVCIRHWQLG